MNSVIVLLAPSLCGHLQLHLQLQRSLLGFLFDFVVAQCNLIAALPRLRPQPEILNYIPYILYVAVHKYIEKESEINFLLALCRFRAFPFYDALVKTHDAPLMRNATGDETEVSRLASSGVESGWVEFSSVEVLMCRKGAQTIEG